jgi:hypothetical protein
MNQWGMLKLSRGYCDYVFLNKKDDHRFDNQSDQFGTTASTKKAHLLIQKQGSGSHVYFRCI